jgi:putative transposase
LKLSKQAVHQHLKRHFKQKDEEMQLLQLIYQIRSDHPTMGLRDMYYKIQPESMGRDAFEQFCKSYQLMSKRFKNYRNTTDSSGVIRFDNLLLDARITDIDQVWQSDISYYEVKGKFYYLTFIIDAYSRRIIGHQTSERLYTEQTTLPALQMAIKTRCKKDLQGLIFHSDGGGQYYDKAFLTLTKNQKIRNSMCEFAWENGKAERINGVIKNNYLKHRTIANYMDLTKEVDRSVQLYNEEKPHIRLKRKSPITFEKEIAYLRQQTKPKMTESFEAIVQIYGASSPLKSEQTKPQNRDVF